MGWRLSRCSAWNYCFIKMKKAPPATQSILYLDRSSHLLSLHQTLSGCCRDVAGLKKNCHLGQTLRRREAVVSY